MRDKFGNVLESVSDIEEKLHSEIRSNLLYLDEVFITPLKAKSYISLSFPFLLRSFLSK